MRRFLLLVFLLLVSGFASAADKGEAFVLCRAYVTEQSPYEVPNGYEFKIEDEPGAGTTGRCAVYKRHTSGTPWTFMYQAAYQTGCPAGKEWDPATQTCKNGCIAGTASTATARVGVPPSSCNGDGCAVSWSTNGIPFVIVDSTGAAVNLQQWSGVTTTSSCNLGPDADGDGTTDANDGKPNDPTEVADSDGDGIGDNQDSHPNDADNGKDDGTGDESDNTSSGGGTCSSPPVSSGDAIAAQIAYQTWATRCAAEKTNAHLTGNGGNGGVTIIGGGSGPGTDLTETNNKLDGIKDGIDGLTDVEGADINAGIGDGSGEPSPGSVMKETEYLSDGFDMSGFGWGNTCPAIPSFTVKGHTIQLDPDGKFCDFMTLGGWFVLVVMSLKCLRMLGAA